mmetsp:Transcript_29358/g.68358  ORF Transcript_29358/g.68358 Transcript_29358/m.68358 type:complete len:360 (-) Transcript_29358:70-1149(-)
MAMTTMSDTSGQGQEKRDFKKGAKAQVVPTSHRRHRYDSQFYKTKVCMFWQQNKCVRGESCKYAHGDLELQNMPNLEKTAMCRSMLQTGQCPNTDCPFAHNTDELRATDKFYKTTMCCFSRYGTCRLGAACRHAHTESELRPNPDTSAASTAVGSSSAASEEGDPLRLGRTNRVGSLGAVQQQAAPLGLPQRARWDEQSDDEDELTTGEWARMQTMPAALSFPKQEEVKPMPAPMQYAKESPARMYNPPAPAPVANPGTAEQDALSDDFSEDELGPLPGWERMHTMPASLGQGVGIMPRNSPHQPMQMAPMVPLQPLPQQLQSQPQQQQQQQQLQMQQLQQTQQQMQQQQYGWGAYGQR